MRRHVGSVRKHFASQEGNEVRNNFQLFDKGQRKRMLEDLQYQLHMLNNQSNFNFTYSTGNLLLSEVQAHRVSLSAEPTAVQMLFLALIRPPAVPSIHPLVFQNLLIAYTTLLVTISLRNDVPIGLLSHFSAESVASVLKGAVTWAKIPYIENHSHTNNNSRHPKSSKPPSNQPQYNVGVSGIARKRKFSSKIATTLTVSLTDTLQDDNNSANNNQNKNNNHLNNTNNNSCPIEQSFLLAIYVSRVFFALSILQQQALFSNNHHSDTDTDADADAYADLALADSDRDSSVDRVLWLRAQLSELQQRLCALQLPLVWCVRLLHHLNHNNNNYNNNNNDNRHGNSWFESWVYSEVVSECVTSSVDTVSLLDRHTLPPTSGPNTNSASRHNTNSSSGSNHNTYAITAISDSSLPLSVHNTNTNINSYSQNDSYNSSSTNNCRINNRNSNYCHCDHVLDALFLHTRRLLRSANNNCHSNSDISASVGHSSLALLFPELVVDEDISSNTSSYNTNHKPIINNNSNSSVSVTGLLMTLSLLKLLVCVSHDHNAVKNSRVFMLKSRCDSCFWLISHIISSNKSSDNVSSTYSGTNNSSYKISTNSQNSGRFYSDTMGNSQQVLEQEKEVLLLSLAANLCSALDRVCLSHLALSLVTNHDNTSTNTDSINIDNKTNNNSYSDTIRSNNDTIISTNCTVVQELCVCLSRIASAFISDLEATDTLHTKLQPQSLKLQTSTSTVATTNSMSNMNNTNDNINTNKYTSKNTSSNEGEVVSTIAPLIAAAHYSLLLHAVLVHPSITHNANISNNNNNHSNNNNINSIINNNKSNNNNNSNNDIMNYTNRERAVLQQACVGLPRHSFWLPRRVLTAYLSLCLTLHTNNVNTSNTVNNNNTNYVGINEEAKSTKNTDVANAHNSNVSLSLQEEDNMRMCLAALRDFDYLDQHCSELLLEQNKNNNSYSDDISESIDNHHSYDDNGFVSNANTAHTNYTNQIRSSVMDWSPTPSPTPLPMNTIVIGTDNTIVETVVATNTAITAAKTFARHTRTFATTEPPVPNSNSETSNSNSVLGDNNTNNGSWSSPKNTINTSTNIKHGSMTFTQTSPVDSRNKNSVNADNEISARAAMVSKKAAVGHDQGNTVDEINEDSVVESSPTVIVLPTKSSRNNHLLAIPTANVSVMNETTTVNVTGATSHFVTNNTSTNITLYNNNANTTTLAATSIAAVLSSNKRVREPTTSHTNPVTSTVVDINRNPSAKLIALVAESDHKDTDNGDHDNHNSSYANTKTTDMQIRGIDSVVSSCNYSNRRKRARMSLSSDSLLRASNNDNGHTNNSINYGNSSRNKDNGNNSANVSFSQVLFNENDDDDYRNDYYDPPVASSLTSSHANKSNDSTNTAKNSTAKNTTANNANNATYNTTNSNTNAVATVARAQLRTSSSSMSATTSRSSTKHNSQQSHTSTYSNNNNNNNNDTNTSGSDPKSSYGSRPRLMSFSQQTLLSTDRIPAATTNHDNNDNNNNDDISKKNLVSPAAALQKVATSTHINIAVKSKPTIAPAVTMHRYNNTHTTNINVSNGSNRVNYSNSNSNSNSKSSNNINSEASSGWRAKRKYASLSH